MRKREKRNVQHAIDLYRNVYSMCCFEHRWTKNKWGNLSLLLWTETASFDYALAVVHRDLCSDVVMFLSIISWHDPLLHRGSSSNALSIERIRHSTTRSRTGVVCWRIIVLANDCFWLAVAFSNACRCNTILQRQWKAKSHFLAAKADVYVPR